MPYAPFHEKFLDIAERETRSVMVFNNPDIPSDDYGLLEFFCDEPGCDCRRVFLYVVTEKCKDPLAVWESEKFYQQWLGRKEPQIIKELICPVLNLASPQSKLASPLLKLVQEVVLSDKQYVQRVIRHYEMYRQKIEEEHKQPSNAYKPLVSNLPKTGRNELCPCGSGKKYKHCCLH